MMWRSELGRSTSRVTRTTYRLLNSISHWIDAGTYSLCLCQLPLKVVNVPYQAHFPCTSEKKAPRDIGKTFRRWVEVRVENLILSKSLVSPKLELENLIQPNRRQPPPLIAMAEPPAKRAKRTDSSAMWERNSPRPTDASHLARATNGTSGVREKRDDRDRHHGRDGRRHRSRSRERRRDRSRSRERPDKPHRERSYSRERGGRRYKDGDRDGARDRRDRERSRSRGKHRSRRGWWTESNYNRHVEG